jgi:hypothetical protein
MSENKKKSLDSYYNSAGMSYLKNQRSHKFSFNIFVGNLNELRKVLVIIENPKMLSKIMSDKNRETLGESVHMELMRHLHNFLAGAKSLIEHTRVFLKQHYDGTNIKSVLEQKVKNEFSEDPLSRFIQDLRNYMLHKGPLNTTLSMTYQKIAEPNQFKGGSKAYLKKSELLAWSRWSKQAKNYLNNSPDQLQISSFCDEYAQKVLSLYTWFYKELYSHHENDYKDLVQLHNKLFKDFGKKK